MQPPHRRPLVPLLLLASFAVVAVCASAAELLAHYRVALGSSDFVTRLAQASELSPLNWSFTHRRGAALRKLGRYEEAREMYEQALEQTSDTVRARGAQRQPDRELGQDGHGRASVRTAGVYNSGIAGVDAEARAAPASATRFPARSAAPPTTSHGVTVPRP